MSQVDDEVVTTRPQGNETRIASAQETFDVEFGDEELMSRSDGFDKIAPPQNDKSKVVRVNLLTDVVPLKSAYIHFITGKGPIRCASKREKGIKTQTGLCCRKLNQPRPNDKQNDQLAVVALAFWYKNAGPLDGKYPKDAPPIDWQLGWIKLSRSGFRRVSNLIPEEQHAYDLDLLIAHGDGVGYEYSVVASRCRFRQNPALVAEVMEAAEQYRDGEALMKKLGRQVTDIELLQMIADQSGGATSAATAKVTDPNDLG